MNSPKYESGAGFTIIELIITIFILSLAVVGVFGAFSIMVILTSNITDRLTAAYLAQEGVEIIRNIRDNNWLYMDENLGIGAWDDGLLPCKDGSSCRVDYTTTGSDSSPVFPWQENSYLKTDETNFFYSYRDGIKTKFRRKITITCLPDNNCLTDYIMKVNVEIFWDEKPSILNPTSAPGSIQVEDTLYNWYNYNI